VIDTHHFDRHGVLLSDADPAGSGSASLLVACCELFSRIILPSSVSTFTPPTVTSSGVWTVTLPNLDRFRDINRGLTFYRHA
jgi:hypothetical protein